MPLYNFATYADVREEWAIDAKDLDNARRKVGDDPSGDWLNEAVHIDADSVHRRDDFYVGADGETPEIEEITPQHWAWRAAHREWIERSLRQNIAAIAGDFHTHPCYWGFHDMFGKHIDGFVGHYDLCIAMAQALTDWEVANGMAQAYENAGVPWIEVVESFVNDILETAAESGEIPDPAQTLPAIAAFAGRPS